LISDQNAHIFVHAIGDPDSYGNVIVWMCIYQHNGSAWNLLQNVTSSSNWTQRVVDSQPINFTVKWRLNDTLATSEAEAVTFTKVTMNISQSVWTNEELNITSTDSDASFYYGIERGHWNQTGMPASGVTYEVATKYEAYY